MPPAARERLDALKSGLRRTRHLLDQLLALARQDLASQEAGEKVYLDQIAKGVVADFLAESSAREIDLGFAMAEPVLVAADPLAILSLVRNLVENAVKYTPTAVAWTLASIASEEWPFCRSKTGPGVSPQDIERIFEPFYRGRRPTGDGSGLGLSIVKRIVDRYRGSIEVESITEVDRSGFRATVQLPASD